MGYKNWNLRGLNFFQEELISGGEEEKGQIPSIQDFKERGLYDFSLRERLINYIQSAKPIVSTTFKRVNAYTGVLCMELIYFTDGEIIFNNLLQEYIQHDDFVLPKKWIEIIELRNFTIASFEIDFDYIRGGSINIFNMLYEKFDTKPCIERALKLI